MILSNVHCLIVEILSIQTLVNLTLFNQRGHHLIIHRSIKTFVYLMSFGQINHK